MKFELSVVLEDWKEATCERCVEVVEPIYRFCYSSSILDIHENALTTIDIDVCKKCCSKVQKNYKKFLDN